MPDSTTLLSSRLSKRPVFNSVSAAIPAGWNTVWKLAEFTPDVFVCQDSICPYGDVGISAEALFDKFSTARKAPGATFYVNVATGADVNNGLTPATAKKTIGAAIVAANTAAVPSLIHVAGGSYNRANGFYQGGTGAPAVDIAFIADGPIETGTWDDFANPAHDGVATNTYSFALANANRVVDLTQVNRYGNYVELLNVATAALCNIIPNSWALVAGTIYLNRADGAQVTQTNTRIYRANVDNMRCTNPVSIFIGVNDNSAMWDFQGGQNGCLRYNPATKPATNKGFIVNRARNRFGGGIVNTTGNGVAVDSIHGLAALFNCQADANWSDGFNFHNALTPTAHGYAMTVNCGASDNGRLVSASNNGWTTHEDVIGIDVCGIMKGNRGGSYRSVNFSISWLVDPIVRDDFGDVMNGGSIQPTAFRVDTAATYFITNPKADIIATGFRYYIQAGASIFTNHAFPSRYLDYVAGTLDRF